jgi:hypothetical protein
MLNINNPAENSGNTVDRRRWARLLIPLLGMTAVLAGFFGVVYLRTPARAQMRPIQQQVTNRPGFTRGQGFGRGGMQPEQKLVRQFDKNGDGRLDAPERKAARDWLAAQGSNERRGPRFGGGFAPASAGPRVSPADARMYPEAPAYDPNAQE